MKRSILLLACLVLPTPLWGQEQTQKPILVLDTGGHTGRVRKVLFSPDGKELISVSADKTIRIWDARTGEMLRMLHLPIGNGPEGMLYAGALSPDGKRLAVGGYGPLADRAVGTIYLIALPSGSLESTLRGHENIITALAFSPDGKRLASGSGDSTARLWNVETGHCELTLKGHSHSISGIAFAPDGQRLVTASFDKTARLWSPRTGQCEAVLSGHEKEVPCTAWSPDGKTIATGSWDHSIRLWDSAGAHRRTFELGNHILSVTFTADSGQLLFTRGPGTGPVTGSLLDLNTGEERVRFNRHSTTVITGALSPDGKLAATAGFEGEVYLWQRADASLALRLLGKGKSFHSAAWSKDGHAIAWGTSWQGDLLQLNVRLERSFRLEDLELGPPPDHSFRRAQPSRGDLSLEKTAQSTIAVRQGGQKTTELTLGSKYDNVCCFTLLPEDRAAVGADSGLYLFNTSTGKHLRTFQGHTEAVRAVAPSPDNRYLLSASADQTLRIWTPEQGEPLLSLFFAGEDWIAWTSQGYYAASPGGEKLMGWHLNNGKDKMASFYPAAQFRKSLYRPDVIKLLLKNGSVEKALEEADNVRGKASERTEVEKVLPPKVSIISPPTGAKLNQAVLTIEATATSTGKHPVTTFRLLLDGRPFFQDKQGARLVEKPQLGQARMSWVVPLSPGKHKLIVQADSAVSQGLSDEVEVDYAGELQAEVELPALYVLAIGVAQYKEEALQLNYSAKDAQAVVDALQKHSKPLFKKIEVKLLTDQKATRGEILKGLTWLRQQMTQRDFAVVFFSGHGDRDTDGAFYLLPVDADPADLLSTCLLGEQFTKPLVALPGKVTLLLDACHSGGVDSGKRKAARSLTDDLVRDLTTDESGLVVMCSSTGREFSLENNEHRQSNFTLALVEGLSGKATKATSGVVYLHHLDAYITDRVKELTMGRQHPVTSRPASIRSFPLAKP